MPTLAERAKASRPKTTSVSDIPAVPEIEATLHAASNGSYRNQYRGRFDKAGSVRVRVYAPGDAKKLSGEVLAATIADETDIEEIEIKGTALVKIEYRNTLAPNTLVVLWAPAKANIEGVRITL